MSIARPNAGEYAPYFGNYISKVQGDDALATLESQAREVELFLRAIPESQTTVLHAPYTWTLKQVVGHLIDAERIFAYRALRFARNDAQPLPGFDENAYVPVAKFERLNWSDLVDEFAAVRRATILMFLHLPDDCWTRQGTASGSPMSVRAAAYTIAGHVNHHLAIMRKRLA